MSVITLGFSLVQIPFMIYEKFDNCFDKSHPCVRAFAVVLLLGSEHICVAVAYEVRIS